MIKQKSWIWWLTIFANTNITTTIYPHIYVSKHFYGLSKKSQERIITHESVHLEQQKKGLVTFLFLYIFCLPFVWNPWRYQWEYDAYIKEGKSNAYIKQKLRNWKYGWLLG